MLLCPFLQLAKAQFNARFHRYFDVVITTVTIGVARLDVSLAPGTMFDGWLWLRFVFRIPLDIPEAFRERARDGVLSGARCYVDDARCDARLGHVSNCF